MTNQEINEAVARKLGWSWENDGRVYHRKGFLETMKDLPDYCTSIAAAWEVVEKVKVIYVKGDEYVFEIFREKTKWRVCWYSEHDYFYKSTTHMSAPMAICLAFLKIGLYK